MYDQAKYNNITHFVLRGIVWNATHDCESPIWAKPGFPPQAQAATAKAGRCATSFCCELSACNCSLPCSDLVGLSKQMDCQQGSNVGQEYVKGPSESHKSEDDQWQRQEVAGSQLDQFFWADANADPAPGCSFEQMWESSLHGWTVGAQTGWLRSQYRCKILKRWFKSLLLWGIHGAVRMGKY